MAREQAALAAGSATSPGGAGASGGSPGSEGNDSDAQQAQPGQTASPVTCYYLSKELRRVVDEEWVLRGKLWSEGALPCLLSGRLGVPACAHGPPLVACLGRPLLQGAAHPVCSAVPHTASPLPSCCPAGLRRSRRCDLAVGFEEGATDDAECTFCHLYMHLSAGGLCGRGGAGFYWWGWVWDAGGWALGTAPGGSTGRPGFSKPLTIPTPPPTLCPRSRVRLLPRPPRLPAPRLPPVRLRDAGATPGVPPLDAGAGGHLRRCTTAQIGFGLGQQRGTWVLVLSLAAVTGVPPLDAGAGGHLRRCAAG